MASWTLLGSQINGLRNGDQTAASTAISADGKTIVVGSQGKDATVTGYVRVYAWNGSDWTQKGLTIDGFSNGDFFGCFVSISANGLILAVGAIGRNSVYIYDYNSGTNVWDLRSTITNASSNPFFGFNTSLTPDGTSIVVGAINGSGFAEVYTWNGTSWAKRGLTLTGDLNKGFGWYTDISSDGNTIIIGQFGGTGFNKAYVYTWSGTAWVQKGSTLATGLNDGYGISVSMNSDGSIIAVGAPFDSGGARTYVYSWNGTAWEQRGSTLTGGGRNIALSPDGNILSTGNYGANSLTGAINLYQWNGSAWTQIGSTIPGVATNDWFGFGNSVSDNGLIVAGGGPAIGVTTKPGYMRVFKYTPATASAAVDLYANGVSQYITEQTTTTDSQKATVAIDIRSGIKNKVSNFSTAQKTDTQKGYIDAMRAKGINTFTLPSTNFTSFKNTLASVSASATAKNVDIVYPNYVSTTATVDASSANLTNYLHIEVPVNYSFTLQNGVDSVLLTFNGTSLLNGATSLNVDSAIILGDKSFTLRGIGSGMFEVNNYTTVICMMEGTQILTPSGNKPIETLETGDLVISGDGRKLPIQQITNVLVVKTNKSNAPYVIEKEAFGTNCPPNQLIVSPRHAIQLRPGVWEIPMEAAKENKAVYQTDKYFNKRVVYYHITMPNYATDTIVANGQITEALNDGKVKESYHWDSKEHGYIRNVKPTKPVNSISY